MKIKYLGTAAAEGVPAAEKGFLVAYDSMEYEF